MDLAIIAGIFTIAGVAIGAVATLIAQWLANKSSHRLFEKQVQQAKRNILTQKIEELNSIMTECFYTLNFYGNTPPASLNIYTEKIADVEKEFESTLFRDSLWFDKELADHLRNVLISFRQFTTAIWLRLPEQELQRINVNPASYGEKTRELNWDNFFDSYEKARRTLQKRLEIDWAE